MDITRNAKFRPNFTTDDAKIRGSVINSIITKDNYFKHNTAMLEDWEFCNKFSEVYGDINRGLNEIQKKCVSDKARRDLIN